MTFLLHLLTEFVIFFKSINFKFKKYRAIAGQNLIAKNEVLDGLFSPECVSNGHIQIDPITLDASALRNSTTAGDVDVNDASTIEPPKRIGSTRSR